MFACVVCALVSARPLCEHCVRDLSKPHTSGYCAYLGYYPELGKLCKRVKYGGARLLGQQLGEMLGAGIVKQQWPLEAVTFVPTFWFRKAVRGHNAAEQIALGLQRSLHIPLVPMLRRQGYAASQLTKTREQRQQNHNTFVAIPQSQYQRVLLVDDTITTNTTMKFCKTALNQQGIEVYGAAVAIHTADAVWQAFAKP